MDSMRITHSKRPKLGRLSHACLLACVAFAVCLFTLPVQAEDGENPAYRIYLDADMSRMVDAGKSIESGIRAALHEHGNVLGGYPVELVVHDHRGNTKRSKRTLERFQEDPRALALFTGLHSPPLLAHRSFINEHQILTLDPWAAAGPITRPDGEDNWIFRLSIDDSNAGTFIAHAAVRDNIRKPALILEDTGWGKSNQRTMSSAVLDLLGVTPDVAWFKWGIASEAARIIVRNALSHGSDSIFLVGNTPECVKIVEAVAQLPEDQRVPVYSHWGITGGDFVQSIEPSALELVDLKFIQTHSCMFDDESVELKSRAFASYQNSTADAVDSPRAMKAPTGFVHAYDLTHLLAIAADQAELSGDRDADRVALHHALEHLNTTHHGLVRTYDAPFRPYHSDDPDAHEALGVEDYVMARFAPDGTILHLKNSSDDTDTSIAAERSDH